MYRYKIYTLTIESDIDFPQLVQWHGKDLADVTIKAGTMDEDIIEREDFQKYEFKENRCWLCNDTCRILVPNDHSIIYEFKEGMNPIYLRTYILGWGMAMLALMRAEVAMHCSVVARAGKALLICGEPGTGKSTLTTRFLEDGWDFVADDMAFVETREGKAFVKPCFPYQKLCRDVAVEKGYNLEKEIYIDEDKDKYLVRYRGEFSLEEREVDSLIYLSFSPDDKVHFRKIEGIQSFFVCAENMFLRHLLNNEKYNPSIGQHCLKMAGCIETYEIARPVVGDSIDEILREIKSIYKKTTG